MTALGDWLTAHGTTYVELLGFITGALNVWLVTRENIWSWPLGIVNALLYVVVYERTGLYSDTGLQVVYFVLSCYGWWHWLRGGTDNAPVQVTRTSRGLWMKLAAVGVATWIVLFSITSRIPGSALPMLDAALVSISLIAQWMMTRKLLENWILWIAVDIVYIPTLVVKGLQLTAVLYAIFLALAILGLVQWKKSADRALRTA